MSTHTVYGAAAGCQFRNNSMSTHTVYGAAEVYGVPVSREAPRRISFDGDDVEYIYNTP